MVAGYEITTMTVTVLMDQFGAISPQIFTMTAPPGKVPIAAGFYNYGGAPVGSYPSGNSWVFVFAQQPQSETIADLYLISVDA